MILTGKAEEDFEKWLKENYNQILHGTNIDTTYFYDMILLGNIKNIESIINTLIIDFFDSVGIYINTPPYYMGFEKYNRGFESNIIDEKSGEIHDLDNDKDVFNTRLEATTEAIKKANEIYNQNK